MTYYAFIVLQTAALAIVTGHPLIAAAIAGVVLLWTLSAIQAGLPVPTTASSLRYRVFFGAISFLVGALRDILHARFPLVPLPPPPSNVLQMPSPAAPKPPEVA